LPSSAKTGIAIARALHQDPAAPARMLVLDEPTATLPLDEVHTLLSIVRTVAANGVAVLYVTHHLDEILQVAHSVTVLRDGCAVATTSTAQLDESKLIHLLVGSNVDKVHMSQHERQLGKPDIGLRVQGFTSGPVGSLSFDAHRGEIVGIAGITGSGREVVLPAIFGATPRSAGDIEVEGTPVPPSSPSQAIALGIAYLPPDRKIQGGIMELSARENISLTDLTRFWRVPRLKRKQEAAEVQGWFRDLDIRPRTATERPLEFLSGGNQQKALFAKWLRCKPRVLLLDEPTQGVDIGAKMELHRRILGTALGGATVIVSSLDIEELAALCHRVLVLRQGQLVAELTGPQVTFPSIVAATMGADHAGR
jgi:ribose transport system ATP-binding protein